MWKTQPLMMPRRFYIDLDYARHMPKNYVDRVKANVPRKIYDNRFGAPPITHWMIPPAEYISAIVTSDDGTELTLAKRPWENEILQKTLQRKDEYKKTFFASKFFRKNQNKIQPIPAEKWTIFQGDLVIVMTGKDKGKQGYVSHIIRDQNAVFVEGLNMKLFDSTSNSKNVFKTHKKIYSWLEQPLYVHTGQVMLADPNDNDCCIAKWVLNPTKTAYIRVSTRTGYEIPLPESAYRTYEYDKPSNYIEVKEKDTNSDAALRCTYMPKLSTFEQDIEEEMGINKKHEKKNPPTYWY